jgi:hypothetical protein
MPQSYESHAYHPVPTYVAAALWLAGFSLLVAWSWAGRDTLAPALLFLALSILPLIGMSRRYVVRLQDRIIRLEMKVRCAELLRAGEDAKLTELTTKQIVALRFASDEELGELLERAVRERMSPDAIKRAIKRWKPDELRT